VKCVNDQHPLLRCFAKYVRACDSAFDPCSDCTKEKAGCWTRRRAFAQDRSYPALINRISTFFHREEAGCSLAMPAMSGRVRSCRAVESGNTLEGCTSDDRDPLSTEDLTKLRLAPSPWQSLGRLPATWRVRRSPRPTWYAPRTRRRLRGARRGGRIAWWTSRPGTTRCSLGPSCWPGCSPKQRPRLVVGSVGKGGEKEVYLRSAGSSEQETLPVRHQDPLDTTKIYP
jgi:hypothetical protein